MPSSSLGDAETISSSEDARRRFLKLRRKTIERRPDNGRKNPNSLRFVIGLIISYLYDGRQDKAADTFRKSSGRYLAPTNNDKYREMNEKALAGILNDTDYAYYWHLESIAESLRIPTGALLLTSRLYAAMGHNDLASATELSSSLREFANCLDDMIKHRDLREHHIQDMQKIFEKFHQLERDQLKLF